MGGSAIEGTYYFQLIKGPLRVDIGASLVIQYSPEYIITPFRETAE